MSSKQCCTGAMGVEFSNRGQIRSWSLGCLELSVLSCPVLSVEVGLIGLAGCCLADQAGMRRSVA